MPRFDIGKFMETGGKYAYEILSEEKKYKKKMDEIEARIKGEKEEEEKKRQANLQEGIFTGFVSLLGDPDVDAFTKRTIYQGHILPVLTGMGQATPTQAGTTMPGGTAGVEGLPPLRPEDVAGAGALFEAPPEEPEKYPQTRGEVREHEEFKAGLKKPAGAMGEVSLENLEQKYRKAASDIRRGKILRTGWGGMKREVKFATPEIAINEIQSEYGIGPTDKRGLWDKHITKEIDTRFPGYLESPEKYEVEQFKKDPLIRKKIKTHLRKDLKIRDVTEEKIDMYIERNPNIARQLKQKK